MAKEEYVAYRKYSVALFGVVAIDIVKPIKGISHISDSANVKLDKYITPRISAVIRTAKKINV